MDSNNSNNCAICLEAIKTRGGRPISIPGCCGAFFHEDCLALTLRQSPTPLCPLCRASLTKPSTAPSPAAPVPPLPQPPTPVAPPAVPARYPNVLDSLRNLFGSAATTMTTTSRHSVRSSWSTRTRSLLDEEPVDEVPSLGVDGGGSLNTSIEAASDLSDASPASTLPRVTITTTPEYAITATASITNFYASVTVSYDDTTSIVDGASAKDNSTPLDLVCVLDNSGSMMSEDKLVNVIRAMEFVISRLAEKDRLSVVNFNSTATVLQGLHKMTAANKERTKAVVNVLRATGGTDILDGMVSGWSILKNRRTCNPTSCIFLLTDGQDGNNTAQKLELAKEIKASGSSLLVFGFGADHDSAHMNAIANAAEGSFVYVETGDTVIDAFGGALGAQQGLSLRRVRLSITPEAGNVVTNVSAGNYSVSNGAAPGEQLVTYANLFPGEKRDVLVRLDLPALTAPTVTFPLFLASANFQVPTSAEGGASATAAAGGALTTVSVPAVTATVQRLLPGSAALLEVVRNVDIDAQLAREEVAGAIAEALRLADAGQFVPARSRLERALTELRVRVSFLQHHTLVEALEDDVQDAMRRVGNREEFTSGGRAQMSEMMSSHMNQRNVYLKAGKKKSAYQSPSSISVQFLAKASK